MLGHAMALFILYFSSISAYHAARASLGAGVRWRGGAGGSESSRGGRRRLGRWWPGWPLQGDDSRGPAPGIDHHPAERHRPPVCGHRIVRPCPAGSSASPLCCFILLCTCMPCSCAWCCLLVTHPDAQAHLSHSMLVCTMGAWLHDAQPHPAQSILVHVGEFVWIFGRAHV